MADHGNYGNNEREVEQALNTLKKGSQLIKYSQKGKPNVRSFRLSPDETSLIWLSYGAEKNLYLSTVSRIITGQRTAVFKKNLRPEKEQMSFSLIHSNGERSLDLICKDKVEADSWIIGLKALIGRNRSRHTRSDISDLSDALGFHDLHPYDSPGNWRASDVGSEHMNMQARASVDGFRISVSSWSSGGSGPDDIESLADVYIWGQVWGNVLLSDGSLTSTIVKNDVLTPKPLESNVVLDVHQISCGAHHAALVTRQGEVFTWGEESGGRLGHGIEKDFSRPRLVELLAATNVDCVTCGEHHTCIVSTSGDLFTWGDGCQIPGLLGHGTEVSHWIPKRVSGPLEGLQVLSIACGVWHSALVTSSGRLFTFGDGTFGVLGHGDRKSVSSPKEVKLLSDLKTVKVACGAWHSAAIVEVPNQSVANVLSKKLFTWGNGGKNQLGHGNTDTYLVPTCVSPLMEYNFQQIACGYTMTVALSVSGHVFSMGSNAYGQLGNPNVDAKIPAVVQEKLTGEFVEEISCGSHHVAVLTSRSEMYTWGRGANGRLGHGDVEDKKVPTLVEALKDRHIKNISCGSNFTACICLHKWVSGADQSLCSGCKQQFGFTRKRHNCYNCGLVHCHACSSKKAFKAALAPTPGKPHRVCDACFTKLKSAESSNMSNVNRKVSTARNSMDMSERGEVRTSRILLPPSAEPLKNCVIKFRKHELKPDYVVRAVPVPVMGFSSPLAAVQYVPKPAPPPPQNSRSSSPHPRRPSPPRSASPGFSRGVVDGLRRTNEHLRQDLIKMQSQIKILKQKCDLRETENAKLQQEALEESSRSKEAKEIMKSISNQLEKLADQLPPDIQESETYKTISLQIESFLSTNDVNKSTSPHGSIDSNQETESDSVPLTDESNSIQEQREAEVDNQADDTGSSSLSDQADDVGSSSFSNESGRRTEITGPPSLENESRTNSVAPTMTRSISQAERTDQFEPGVYVTYVVRPNGIKVFKRVRFSKKRFQEKQAEAWWNENKDRMFRRYMPHVHTNATAVPVSSLPATEPGAFGATSSKPPATPPIEETTDPEAAE